MISSISRSWAVIGKYLQSYSGGIQQKKIKIYIQMVFLNTKLIQTEEPRGKLYPEWLKLHSTGWG